MNLNATLENMQRRISDITKAESSPNDGKPPVALSASGETETQSNTKPKPMEPEVPNASKQSAENPDASKAEASNGEATNN